MSDIEDSDITKHAEEEESLSLSRQKAKEHVEQLERLKEKDPEFYQFLKEHDKELLEFDDEDIDEGEGTDLEEDVESQTNRDKEQKPRAKDRDKEQKPQAKVVTTAMVDSWCQAVKKVRNLGAVRSLLRAFKTACHYGDDVEDGSAPQFSIMSSNVFNKIMVFVLNEMDGILRGLLQAPRSGGKKETIIELMTTQNWEKHGSLMKLYLGNALHILIKMTDEQMISFTLKRVKASAVFLAAYPILLRKYIKVALHCWGTGRGALPVVSFLFLRDLCVRLGSDCLATCLKGVYKAYIFNCKLSKSVSRSKLQHIQFLGNCVSELYGLDPPAAYQHAFAFIRQLAVILRGALTERGNKKDVKDKKEGKKQQESSKSKKKQNEKPYQKVYDWQFIFCLELWTGVICTYNSEDTFHPLAYPVTQIIYGVASLVPTARYFPLRLRCIRMLNRVAGATGTFIPLSSLLLSLLEMKELSKPLTGGVGKAVHLLNVKQVDKTTLKTRGFQEACIYSMVEELAEHLSQWSYSAAFFELSFIPLVRLRSFCKSTKADRFRREIKELIRQVEANCDFTNSKRIGIEFSPNDPAAASFLEAEKESGSSPLSKFVANLCLKSQHRIDSMVQSSVLVGAESSVFANRLAEMREQDDDGDAEEGAAVFSSSWLPEKKSKVKDEEKSSKKRRHEKEQDAGADEDVVEDLVLSDDEDDDDDGDDEAPDGGLASDEKDHDSGTTSLKQEGKRRKLASSWKQGNKKHKLATASSKKRGKPRPKKKARKGANN